MAPMIDSEFVRGSSPSRSERWGRWPSCLHPVQQTLGAERGGGEDDLVGGQHPGGLPAAELGLGVADVDVVPAAQSRGEIRVTVVSGSTWAPFFSARWR